MHLKQRISTSRIESYIFHHSHELSNSYAHGSWKASWPAGAELPMTEAGIRPHSHTHTRRQEQLRHIVESGRPPQLQRPSRSGSRSSPSRVHPSHSPRGAPPPRHTRHLRFPVSRSAASAIGRRRKISAAPSFQIRVPSLGVAAFALHPFAAPGFNGPG